MTTFNNVMRKCSELSNQIPSKHDYCEQRIFASMANAGNLLTKCNFSTFGPEYISLETLVFQRE